jgi:hypothetical protein
MEKNKREILFLFLFLFIVVNILTVSAANKFVLAASGDECEDVPGCRHANKTGLLGGNTIFNDDDCDLSKFGDFDPKGPDGVAGTYDDTPPIAGTHYVDNPCPGGLGYPQPTLAFNDNRLSYQEGGNGNNHNFLFASDFQPGDTVIVGTAWDDDGWGQKGKLFS